MAVKPGQYPRGLAAGARVLAYARRLGLVYEPSVASRRRVESSRSRPWSSGLTLAGDGQGSTVITLLLDATDAARLAAASTGAGWCWCRPRPRGADRSCRLIVTVYCKGAGGATTTASVWRRSPRWSRGRCWWSAIPAGGDLMRRHGLAASPGLVDLAAPSRAPCGRHAAVASRCSRRRATDPVARPDGGCGGRSAGWGAGQGRVG